MEEEINLRELIETLLRGKWIIIGITAFAVIAAALVSFFVLEEKYEAESTIMANNLPKNTEQAEGSSWQELVKNITEYPEMTLQTFQEQVKNPVLLQQAIEDLDLDPQKYTVHSLREGKVKAEVVENTNLIRIKVTDKDPKKAEEISNYLANNFVNFITDKSRQRLEDSVQFLEEQIDEQENEMEQAVEEYKKFLTESNGVEELEQEYQTKLSLLTQFKKQKVQNEVDIQQIKSSLQQVNKDLQDTPEKLVTKKSIAEDSYLFDVAQSTSDGSIKELSGLTMSSEEINPVHTNLADRRVQLQKRLARVQGEQETLDQKIASISKEVENLQAELAEKRIVKERLSNEVDMLRDNYNMLTQKYQDTKMSTSAQIGKANIMVLSEATLPQNPVAPREKLNVAVAGVLGLMIGVFAVFFREFWRNSAPEKENEQE